MEVRRRTSDHTQDFTRRGLLLQRFLEFLEQPHILDGDNRLVGEGPEQRNLIVREWPNLKATNEDYTESNALTQQRHRKKRTTLVKAKLKATWESLFLCSTNVVDMDRLMVDNSTAGHDFPCDGSSLRGLV